MKEDLVPRIEKGMLRWFGHIEMMERKKIDETSIQDACGVYIGRGFKRIYEEVRIRKY